MVFSLNLVDYGLTGEGYSIWRVTSDGRDEMGAWDQQDEGHLSVHLPPRKIILIEIGAELG